MHMLSSELVLRAAARRMGISFEEYIQHRKAGEFRCSGPCKRWFKHGVSGRECNDCSSLRKHRKSAQAKGKLPKSKLRPIAFIADPERADEPKPTAPGAWKRKDFTPTKLPPGASKVELLAWRYENGLPLWHDDDARNGKTESELAGCDAPLGGNAFVRSLLEDLDSDDLY